MWRLLAVIIVVFLTPTTAQAFPTQTHIPKRQEASYDEFEALARHVDYIFDHLDASYFPTITDEETVHEWIEEVVPFFSYEGVTDPNKDEDEWGGMSYPLKVTFDYATTADEHIHTLATANCMYPEININGRFLNPTSPLYNDPDFLATIVHELAHVQRICYGDERLDSEVSAQLVTLEVLAAMVDHGNRLAFGPLISDLRDMTVKAARESAIQNGREKDFDALVHDVFNAYEIAKLAKSDRHWQETDPERGQYILLAYNFVPINEILFALRSKTCFYWEYDADRVAETTTTVYKQIYDERPCITGVVLPINISVFHAPLYVDDLAYVLSHLDNLAEL